MPQPTVNQSVNPSDPTTKQSGKNSRPTDINVLIRDLQTRVDKLEKALSGGVLLTNQSGTVSVRLSVDNSGNPVWTRI